MMSRREWILRVTSREGGSAGSIEVVAAKIRDEYRVS